jgi:hypothetical protein
MAYTADLCTGGAAISGGDYSSYSKNNAFDNSEDTLWVSLQTGNGIGNVSYIGYNFGSLKSIKKIRCCSAFSYSSYYCGALTVKAQGHNGVSWVDIQTFNVSDYYSVDKQWFELIITSPQPFYQCRLLAGDDLFGTYHWGIREIEMMALVEESTYYSYIISD